MTVSTYQPGSLREAAAQAVAFDAPKRVLFADHTASMGGGEIALLQLVRHLERARFTPVVALFSEGPLAGALAAAGAEVHVLPLAAEIVRTRKDSLGLKSLGRVRDAARMAAYVGSLVRFIRAQRIDLVHTNSLKADVIGGIAARLARKPLIWHVRDRIAEDYLPRPVALAFRRLCRVLPGYVVANSEATLRALALPARKRAQTIYSGIEVDNAQTGDEIREERAGPCIGLVGRISPWKGQHIFLQAAAKVRERYPKARFQIVGSALFEETDYERRLEALTACLGLEDAVVFTGFRADVPDLIARMDILVHASTTGEPFGKVVVEGMAAGKPVVATDGGGIPEIVMDGVTGLLVPMGDSEAMAKAICWLLADPELGREMGCRGQQRVRAHFTIQQTTRQMERLYDEIFARSRQRPRKSGADETASVRG